MEAGRELDAKVGADVIGLPIGACRNIYWPEDAVSRDGDNLDGGRFHEPIPRFSTDIAATWQVVEKVMECTRLQFHVGYALDLSGEARWYAYFGGPYDPFSAQAETAPLAICRAALKAMEATE